MHNRSLKRNSVLNQNRQEQFSSVTNILRFQFIKNLFAIQKIELKMFGQCYTHVFPIPQIEEVFKFANKMFVRICYLESMCNVSVSLQAYAAALAALAFNFPKYNTPLWMFCTSFKLQKQYQIAQSISNAFHAEECVGPLKVAIFPSRYLPAQS